MQKDMEMGNNTVENTENIDNNRPEEENMEKENNNVIDYEALGIIIDEPLVPVNTTFKAEDVKKRIDDKTMVVDNPIQRSWKWEQKRSSLLIHSAIVGIPIPPMWARKVDGGKDKKGKQIWIYDIVDGKQRTLAFAKYMNDEYALKDIPPILLDDKVFYLNGLKYSELPDELKDRIRNTLLTYKGFDNITDLQLKEVFKRLNNGKPLTGKEKSIANCSDITNLTEMGKHQFFATTYTEKSLEARKQLPILMKIYMVLHDDVDTLSFENSDMEEAMGTNITTESDRREIVLLLDKALAIYNCIDSKYTSRKFANETNFISLVPFIQRAMQMEIPDSLMADFVQEYFGRKESVSAVYSINAKQGSGKNSAIIRRHEELEKAWAEFFADDADEPDGPVEEPTKPVEAPAETAPDNYPAETETPSEGVLEAKNGEWSYGMRARGFSIGCQPKEGFIRQEDDPEGKYHDIIVYDRELTEDEIWEYELDLIKA